MRFLRRISRALLYGGNRHFRTYEERVLEALTTELTIPEAEVLREQLAHVERIQRFGPDRIVSVFFDPDEEIPLLSKRQGSAGMRVFGFAKLSNPTKLADAGAIVFDDMRALPRLLDNAV